MPQMNSNQLDLAPRHLAILQSLLAHYVPEAEVWAFGSRVNGKAHEGSDLDLVLRNARELTLPVTGYFELQEALQKSSLPMLIDIHDWAHLPEDFHRNIERSYVVLKSGRGTGSANTPEIGGLGV
jgi:predicted nucleotidyltransferase